MAAQLVALSLIVAVAVQTMLSRCDFGDNHCDTVTIVAEILNGAAIVADRASPDRTNGDGDNPDSDSPDGHQDAAWVTDPGYPGVSDRLSRAAWYPPRDVLRLASVAVEPPDLPPRA